MTTEPDWRSHARALADQLRASGDLIDARWHAAVAATPRHVLVPQALRQNEQYEWETVDTSTAVGLELVYSPTTLITKLDARGWAISSSTKPDLMVRMLETLDIHDEHRVLEVGTGTGYNAALLTHRLGGDHVTTVDVDPDLIDTARLRLAGFDAYPTLATVDGQHGYPPNAPYDRIIATCSVPAVPWAWAEQLTPDGRILVSVMPGGDAGNLVLLQRHDDRLEGRFTARIGIFMPMRHSDTPAPTATRSTPTGEPSQRVTTAPAEPWRTCPVAWLWATLALPGMSRGYLLDQHGKPTASRITTPDGSWTTVPFGEGERVLTEAGATPIWKTIEHAQNRWNDAGQPGWDRLGLTVTPQHQTLWLDTPDNAHRWRLDAR